MQNFLGETVYNQGKCSFFIHASLATVKQLIFVYFGRRGFMLNTGLIIFDFEVGHRMGATIAANQQTVTLGVVAAVFGFGVH